MIVNKKTALIDGPSNKKFKVLAALMARDLDKKFSKHLVGPVN